MKNIGGLPILSVLLRREYQKKDRPQLEDSVLVEDLEELVETNPFPPPTPVLILGKSQVTTVRILPNKHSQLARYCLVWGSVRFTVRLL